MRVAERRRRCGPGIPLALPPTRRIAMFADAANDEHRAIRFRDEPPRDRPGERLHNSWSIGGSDNDVFHILLISVARDAVCDADGMPSLALDLEYPGPFRLTHGFVEDMIYVFL